MESVWARLPKINRFARYVRVPSGRERQPLANTWCRAQDRHALVSGKVANYPRWTAQYQNACGNPHPLGDENPRADNAVTSDVGFVHDDGTHAYQNFVVNSASVDDGAVPTGHSITYDCRVRAGNMDNGAVLDIAPATDLYRVDIAPEHALIPDA